LTPPERRPLKVEIGFASERGRRPDNQDYVGAHLGDPLRGVAAAVADGIGGAKGGREAAELTVRSFLEAYYALPETLGVPRAAARAIEPINRWVHAQGRADPQLAGMGCTFSALVLARRRAHVFHVGDSRIYRFNRDGLEALTDDHVLGRGDLKHVLMRAVGLEPSLKLDHRAVALRPHDRFLICSDGVHGALDAAALARRLDARASPQETARALVDDALAAGSRDNATALVADIVDLPPPEADELAGALRDLPILPLPKPGDEIDGFRLVQALSDSRYSRLFRAQETPGGPLLALKFPHPRVAAEESYRLAFLREAWVAARVRSAWIGEMLELPPGRQTRLYSAMPFYEGETLEARLRRAPVSLADGARIASRLARAIDALHRAGIVHRDIKPDNVILTTDGGLRLIDLGVARAPRLEEFPLADIPGTPSYMAPELFEGQAGDEASDLFAFGVTLYRMFGGAYPYGEIEPFTRPKFGRYVPLSRLRPDLPAWLDARLTRAVSLNRAQRYGDALELAYEIEHGARSSLSQAKAAPPLHERHPTRVWQFATFALAVVALFLAFKLAGGRLR